MGLVDIATRLLSPHPQTCLYAPRKEGFSLYALWKIQGEYGEYGEYLIGRKKDV